MSGKLTSLRDVYVRDTFCLWRGPKYSGAPSFQEVGSIRWLDLIMVIHNRAGESDDFVVASNGGAGWMTHGLAVDR